MAVTVSGGGTTTLTFNVTGSAATNFANDFPGSYPAYYHLSAGEAEGTVPGALNVIDSGGNPASYTLTSPGQYTFVATSELTTVNGSTAGDTLIGGSSLTYVEAPAGSDNRVIFTSGENTFEGSSSGGSGDTIVGGSGSDTITTGGGPSTVFSGTGHTLVYLGDTVGGGGDLVVLQSGTSTVVGGSVANVSDTVNATAAAMIYGGAGTLTFVAGTSTTPINDTIVGSTGTIYAFGGANLDLTLEGGGHQEFYAAGGNETLDGSLSGGFTFFGDTTGGAATTVYGGNSDYFITGAGTEYFTAGSNDIFEIASVSAATTISIADFSGSDSVKFDSPTVTGTSDGNNFTYTLADGTKVEFIGLTTPPSHII